MIEAILTHVLSANMRGRSLSPNCSQPPGSDRVLASQICRPNSTITADSPSGCAATYKVNICNQGVNKSTLVCFSWTRVKRNQHPLCHKETCGTSWGRIVHTSSEPAPRSAASPRITNRDREYVIAEAAGCRTWDWEQTYSSWWQPGPGLIPAPWCLRERIKKKDRGVEEEERRWMGQSSPAAVTDWRFHVRWKASSGCRTHRVWNDYGGRASQLWCRCETESAAMIIWGALNVVPRVSPPMMNKPFVHQAALRPC